MFVNVDLFDKPRDPSPGSLGLFSVEGWDDYPYASFSTGQEPDPSTSLQLELLLPSPSYFVEFDLEKSVWRILLSNLADGKTSGELVEFDRRVNERYAEFQAMIRWYYTGSYRPHGLD